MDTDRAGCVSGGGGGGGRRDIRWRSGEHCECKSPSFWFRLQKKTRIEGVRMTQHLIYGAFSAPSNVAIDLRAGPERC